MMSGFMALCALVAAILGPSACLADAVIGDVQSNEVSLETSPKNERHMPASASTAISVHALRPGDISVFSAMGLPAWERSTASRLLAEVAEWLSVNNPKVNILPMDWKLQPRNLLEEAEDLSHSLSLYQVADWKFAFLFVPADPLCLCSQQDYRAVEAIAREVEAAVQIMQKKLHHTLIHIVVWSSSTLDGNHSCCQSRVTRNQLQRLILIQTLHELLSHAVANFTKSDDFTVGLHPTPIITDPATQSQEIPVSVFKQLALQLHEGVLRPCEVGPNNDIIPLPCTAEGNIFMRTQKNTPAAAEMASSNAFVFGTEMPCVDRDPSPTIPTSVHELRPGDIKVVAAVGDSLTAANGVGARTNNLLLVNTEYRGLSWSIGGDNNLTTVTTLPNIMREFNPYLSGFSEGICVEDSPKAFLNQAVPGAKSGDMVAQVQVVVNKMKSDARIDFENDWKVITMFIGGNDICDYCTDTIYFSPSNVVRRIRDALDILHKEVPRVIVNLVELLHLIPLRDLHKETGLGCPTWFVKLICPCILNPTEGSVELQSAHDFSRAYQLAMRELVDTGRYDTHDNFTVVLQPFFREVSLPWLPDGRPDRSYFAPDCFHLSQKAHTQMARGLWNNMLEPVGNKTFTQDFTVDIDLKCPTKERPFLTTAYNSNYTFPGPPPTPPPDTNWGSDFSCTDTTPSDSVPSSVHRLRPGDISVVAALGDSFTAATGAKSRNLLDMRTEYRGISWSIGGDKALDTITTLPNILRRFNANIKGVSEGKGKSRTGFNMGVATDKISGVPAQVQQLIASMKNNSAVDFQNDWKLVTLFIGNNDLCNYCNDRDSLSPDNYSNHLKTSLDILYAEVPRALVSVVEILEMEMFRRIERTRLMCSLQKYNCPCVLELREDSPELAELKRINREFRRRTTDLVYGGRYDGKEDFTVVLQPFFRDTFIPLNSEGKADTSYFSADCFHFSERGNAGMARALWNNMLEPVGDKQTFSNLTHNRHNIKCPTEEHPYIFTRVNSFPSLPTTTTPHSTASPVAPACPGNVPVWAAVVLSFAGLLTGLGVAWLFFCGRARRGWREMEAGTEMKGTGFKTTTARPN